MTGNRKRLKRYHEPGDVHELTFSCFHNLPLLEDESRLTHLAGCVAAGCEQFHFGPVAFVFMPNHVHLLVFGTDAEASISRFLAGVKRPLSSKVKADLATSDPRLLQTLTIRERPGKFAFRFWQEGPGYDRNLQHESTVLASIDYIHNNPVRRGLCERACQWYWSSASYYTGGPVQRPLLPPITRLPAEFFSQRTVGRHS
jgi:putative transposase